MKFYTWIESFHLYRLLGKLIKILVRMFYTILNTWWTFWENLSSSSEKISKKTYFQHVLCLILSSWRTSEQNWHSWICASCDLVCDQFGRRSVLEISYPNQTEYVSGCSLWRKLSGSDSKMSDWIWSSLNMWPLVQYNGLPRCFRPRSLSDHLIMALRRKINSLNDRGPRYHNWYLRSFITWR